MWIEYMESEQRGRKEEERESYRKPKGIENEMCGRQAGRMIKKCKNIREDAAIYDYCPA